MAKKENKSAAIRELLKANPKIGGRDAVAALAAKGLKVQPGLFYLVKGKLIGKRGRPRKAVAVARGNGHAVSHDPATLVRDVKELAIRCGGVDRLQELCAALR